MGEKINENYAIKLTYNGKSLSLSESTKYCLKYEIGKITFAIPGTIGVMCFDSIKHLKHFIEIKYLSKNYKFFLVNGINKKKTPDIIPCAYTFDLDQYYNNNLLNIFSNRNPPRGTVCYESVRVIRELTNEELKNNKVFYEYVI